MRYHLKRIAAFAAALLMVFSAVLVLLPVLMPAGAADDPLTREEDVSAWELVDMRTDLNPDEELYKSPAKYQASQFEHIMLYDGDVHTSKMGDLPSVVEDGASF